MVNLPRTAKFMGRTVAVIVQLQWVSAKMAMTRRSLEDLIELLVGEHLAKFLGQRWHVFVLVFLDEDAKHVHHGSQRVFFVLADFIH